MFVEKSLVVTMEIASFKFAALSSQLMLAFLSLLDYGCFWHWCY